MRFSCTVFSLIFIFVTAACSPQSPQPTQTAVSSPTSIPATATDQPEATPTPFPTHPLLPTLTPATPDGDASAYRLALQTADQADEDIARLEQVINEVADQYMNSDHSNSPDFGVYYRAVWYAAWNALAHFPDDPRAEAWRWKMAHYMALSGEGNDAVQVYIALVTSLLNSGRVAVDDLPQHTLLGNIEPSLFLPHFEMQVDKISAPHANNGYIVSIGHPSPDRGLSACFLLAEDSGKYSMFFLKQSYGFGYSYMSRDSTSCYAKDVTGDGVDEVVTNSYLGGHVGTTYIEIYDVSSLPPKVMPFHTNQSSSLAVWGGYFEILAEDNAPILRMSESLGFCDIYANWYMAWNGKWFEVKRGEIKFSTSPGTLFDCQGRITYFADELAPQNAIDVVDISLQKYLSSSESKDEPIEEFRIAQGLYSAYTGDMAATRKIFSKIADEPLLENSVWIAPAKDFLAAYNRPADLYRACLKLVALSKYYTQFIGPETPEFVEADRCDTQPALQYTIATAFSEKQLNEIPTSLRSAGVGILDSGEYDFEGDSKPELWFTVHPTVTEEGEDEVEFWIVSEYLKGLKAIFTAYVPGTPQLSRDKRDPQKQVTLVNETHTIELTRHPQSGEPFASINAVKINSEIEQDLEIFMGLQRQFFLDNQDSMTTYNQMRVLDEKYPTCPFEVEDPDGWSTSVYYDCDAFHYILALSAELAGEENDAVQRYHAIWANAPDSPFAILARLKLKDRE